jgi:WD40 repeat protein
VVVTPEGNRALSASWDNTLKLWDLYTGQVLRTLEAPSVTFNCIAVTPDGKRAVSGSAEKTLDVWDLDNGDRLCTMEGHTAAVYGVAVMPHGNLAVSASWDKTLRVWDLTRGRSVTTFHCDGSAGCCAFADAYWIIGGDAGGHLYFLVLEERARGAPGARAGISAQL